MFNDWRCWYGQSVLLKYMQGLSSRESTLLAEAHQDRINRGGGEGEGRREFYAAGSAMVLANGGICCVMN